MFEYVFFDRGLRDRFAEFVREQGAEVEMDDQNGLLVRVGEEIPEEISDAIDECYERLLQENSEMLEGTEFAFEKNVAGVQVQLADGSPCMIRVDPGLLSRLLTAVTIEELQGMVQTIATAVENPDNRPLCHT